MGKKRWVFTSFDERNPGKFPEPENKKFRNVKVDWDRVEIIVNHDTLTAEDKTATRLPNIFYKAGLIRGSAITTYILHQGNQHGFLDAGKNAIVAKLGERLIHVEFGNRKYEFHVDNEKTVTYKESADIIGYRDLENNPENLITASDGGVIGHIEVESKIFLDDAFELSVQHELNKFEVVARDEQQSTVLFGESTHQEFKQGIMETLKNLFKHLIEITFGKGEQGGRTEEKDEDVEPPRS